MRFHMRERESERESQRERERERGWTKGLPAQLVMAVGNDPMGRVFVKTARADSGQVTKP
jgi:hypothetical protein